MPIFHSDQLMGEAGSQVDVMQNHDNGFSAESVEVIQQLQDFQLVIHIQIGGRLVQKNSLCILS